MSIADYAGRKYDFLALQNVNAVKESKLGLTLFDDAGTSAICVGAQKLAQRWLLEFLTELGSMPGLPTRGTDFMTRVRTGRLRTQLDMTAAFNFAAYAARINLNQEEDDTWPADERLADAKLLSVAFLPGYANMKIAIYSRAGTSRSIILPITTLPQAIS
jgi:hypothetical protein